LSGHKKNNLKWCVGGGGGGGGGKCCVLLHF